MRPLISEAIPALYASCAHVTRSFRIEAGTRGTPVEDGALRQTVSHSVKRGIHVAEITGTRKRHHPDRLQAAARTLTRSSFAIWGRGPQGGRRCLAPWHGVACGCTVSGDTSQNDTPDGSMTSSRMPGPSISRHRRTRLNRVVRRGGRGRASARERRHPVVVSHGSPGKAPGRDRRVACDGIASAADPVEKLRLSAPSGVICRGDYFCPDCSFPSARGWPSLGICVSHLCYLSSG